MSALRHLPNALTLFRLVLAGVFFVVLNTYQYPEGPGVSLACAVAVFGLAALTDWLDGFLARRWQVETAFGRIMDPFCDKVLVLGAFIYLAGPRFADPRSAEHVVTASGVYPWMVATMLARELLVTAIRAELEERGIRFGANIWGKLKTTLQLICVPIVIVIVAFDPHVDGRSGLAIGRDVLVYATVIATVASGVPYVTGAIRAAKGSGV